MLTFRLDHPTDARLHALVGAEGRGPFVELYLAGDIEPTVRYAADEDEGWDGKHPVFWQVVDVLATHGFASLVDVQTVLDLIARDVPADRLPRRLRPLAEALRCLREVCEGA